MGTLGSRQRLEYTAIGDAINLGSRLQGVAQDYFNVPIIVSEETHAEVEDLVATRYLGEVAVKGKEWPVKICSALARRPPAPTPRATRRRRPRGITR